MSVDYLSGSIIGKGEVPTKEFLMDYFGLEEFTWLEFHEMREGIYAQVKIPQLLNNDEMQNLSEPHSKSSVDLVVVLDLWHSRFQLPDKFTICVRVQGDNHGKGQKGWSKSKFDVVQERKLENSGHIVVNVYKRDCPQLFKDRLNEKSRQEIIDSFKFKLPLE